MDMRNPPARLADITKLQVNEALSLDYAKWLACLSETNQPTSASEVFLRRFPHTLGASLVKKALTAPGTTTDATWAQPLVGIKPFVDAFVALARSASLLGRIPGLRTIPFNVKVPLQTGDAGYTWVKQGDPKPVSKFTFGNGVTLAPTKAAAIIVVTRELVQVGVPGSEQALRDTLISGLTAFTDKSFLDPASTAIAETRPGSVTAGTTPVTATASYAADVASLLAAFFTGAPNAIEPVLIANAAHAAAIRSMNSGGGVGVPVIVSEAAGNHTIAMDPSGVFVADAGVDIDISREASIEMVDTPAAPVATSVFTSLFQTNMVGFRTERFVNWTTTPNAVKYLAGA